MQQIHSALSADELLQLCPHAVDKVLLLVNKCLSCLDSLQGRRCYVLDLHISLLVENTPRWAYIDAYRPVRGVMQGIPQNPCWCPALCFAYPTLTV
jgi:hypothetical protein